MTPAEAEQLESDLRKDPEFGKARERLLYFYDRVVDGASAEAERVAIARRRTHILWLIEHHPDHPTLGQAVARISPDPQAHMSDAEGYAEAKKLWLLQTGNKASVGALSNAVYFFEIADKPLAEALLLRAKAAQPNTKWSARFGRLYALGLLGVNGADTSLNDDLYFDNVLVANFKLGRFRAVFLSIRFLHYKNMNVVSWAALK
jgi:hypothetical protein